MNTDVLAQSETFKCHHAGCGRTFGSRPALTMHVIRSHGKGWSTTKNFNSKPSLIEKKRRWNAAMRARYIARGLTSSGKVRKKPFRARNSSYIRQRDRYYAQGLNAKGKPLSKANNRNLVLAQRARRAREANQNKRIQFVYPVPKRKDGLPYGAPNAPLPTEPTRPMVAEMNFCPHCGEKLASWKKDV